ncbi:MAG: ATP-binding cassette domain-containing protein, partial [Actinobacteria bacterium]|nr:ATP-binding cassette domain-containing protein [Actinomycetota bacterium]MSZ68596.1 ATP-binding cassette domain-containing protein [Actinomycetota bacterium]
MSLLEVNNLTIAFGDKKVVDSISFTLEKGSRIGLIGESGSGKSMTSLAIMGLLPDTATVSGSITFEGQELIGLSDREHSHLRGNRMGM